MSDSEASGTVLVEDLGRAPFAQVHAQMLALAAAIRRNELPGKVLLVEHDPVFTAGKATPEADLQAGVVPIERGGQITYHGPGQLVVYPILALPRRDVRWWLKRIEAFGSAVCGAFGLRAEASVDGTGVFVNGHKVASIGVAIRHWINLHGISINVQMDLAPFQQIRPCGLDPTIMSDLTRAAGRAIGMDEAKAAARDAVSLLTSDTLHP